MFKSPLIQRYGRRTSNSTCQGNKTSELCPAWYYEYKLDP